MPGRTEFADATANRSREIAGLLRRKINSLKRSNGTILYPDVASLSVIAPADMAASRQSETALKADQCFNAAALCASEDAPLPGAFPSCSMKIS